MAEYYIKDVIKSMLNMDGPQTISEETEPSLASVTQKESSDDDADLDYMRSTDSLGGRSPGGGARGRSVKEFEEQLSGLKKENFNLKLRIYFLEERMGNNACMDQENAASKNIELMVQVETLRKEVAEKQKLLCQAVKAIDLEEEEHKKDAANKEKELMESRMEYQALLQRFEALQEQYEMAQDEARARGDQCGSNEVQREESREVIDTLETKIENLEKQMSYERSKLNQQLQVLRSNLEERTLALSNAKKRIDSLETMERQVHQHQKRTEIAEAKLAEFEELVEKYRRDNEDLELRLQTAQNEVKMRGSPSSANNSPKSLSRLRSPSTNSPQQNSSKKSLSEQTLSQPDHDSKHELKKACKIIQTLLDKHNMQDKEIKELQKGLKKRDEEIEELSERLKGKEDGKGKKSLRTKISELNLTAAAPASDTERSILENVDDPNEVIEQYRQLTHELDVQKQILEETLKIKTEQMEELQEKYDKIVEDLNQSTMEKSDVGNEKLSSLIEESKEKDKVIERLEKELQKRTCDLQGVVNKELWEKNREIEKLQTKFGDDKIKKILEDKEEDIRVLVEKLEEKRVGEEMLKEKLEQLIGEKKCFVEEIEELKKKVNLFGDEESERIKELKKELEHSEILRLETNEVCHVLSIRLKELALFLDSLLKQKSVLGLLGHQSRIRQYVDQTLDLSRSLSMTINMNPNESLLQLSNISEILKATHNGSLMLDNIIPEEDENHERIEKTSFSVVPDQITLTYQSHLNIKTGDKVEEQAQIIKVLRNQVEALKREIELRDNEMSRISVKNDEQLVEAIVAMEQPSPQYQPHTSIQTPDSILESLMKINLSVDKNSTLNTSTTLKYSAADFSDCESVSEPDISVSKARIGLTNESLKPKTKANQSESTETGFIKSRTPSKRGASFENKQIIKALTQRISDLETRLAEAEVTSNKANAIYQSAAETQENLILRIKDLEEQLVVAQEIKMSADLEIQKLQRTVEELQSNKFNLLQNMDMKSKNVQNMVNQLECEKAQALHDTKIAEERYEAAKQEIAELQVRIQQVHSRTEEEFLRRIDQVEKEYDHKVKMIELKADAQITKITEAANELKTKYETEYVKRNELENLRITINDLESIQQLLGVSEEKIDILKESESQLKEKLEKSEKEYHNKLNDLRVELDKATLQYSQSILEKTKLQEEKTKLEDEFKSLIRTKKEFEMQVADLKTDLHSLKDKFQKQVSVLETQKTKLQLKISELESGNADLKNRLIKLQSQREGEGVSSPASPSSKILDMYFNKVPEIPVFRNGGEDNNAEEIDRQGNSSPDLGIESDQGRFSSLEAQVSIPRPYLKSLELTQSMSNLLDKENSILAKCNHDECRETLKKIMDENTCLHKKLQKSRRLLEETVTQLAKANQRKKEVEKNICREIHKTSQVLRKAKANLESSSDTDFAQKS